MQKEEEEGEEKEEDKGEGGAEEELDKWTKHKQKERKKGIVREKGEKVNANEVLA